MDGRMDEWVDGWMDEAWPASERTAGRLLRESSDEGWVMRFCCLPFHVFTIWLAAYSAELQMV